MLIEVYTMSELKIGVQIGDDVVPVLYSIPLMVNVLPPHAVSTSDSEVKTPETVALPLMV